MGSATPLPSWQPGRLPAAITPRLPQVLEAMGDPVAEEEINLC
ncbi:hypothetical protein [Synechococcus sp. H70.2]